MPLADDALGPFRALTRGQFDHLIAMHQAAAIAEQETVRTLTFTRDLIHGAEVPAAEPAEGPQTEIGYGHELAPGDRWRIAGAAHGPWKLVSRIGESGRPDALWVYPADGSPMRLVLRGDTIEIIVEDCVDCSGTGEYKFDDGQTVDGVPCGTCDGHGTVRGSVNWARRHEQGMATPTPLVLRPRGGQITVPGPPVGPLVNDRYPAGGRVAVSHAKHHVPEEPGR
jgi:hypothetical protein